MVDPEVEAVGGFVARAREAKGWSQIEFTKEMGIFHYVLQRLEAGEEWPDTETARAIEETLEWPPRTLDMLRDLADFTDLTTYPLSAVTIPSEHLAEAWRQENWQ